MGITNYLSRDPAFKAPPPKHESSLVIAIIKQLNIQKSLSLIERATKTEILSSKQEGENKRPTPLLSNSQTSRHQRHVSRAKAKQKEESPMMPVKRIQKAMNRPITDKIESDEHKTFN